MRFSFHHSTIRFCLFFRKLCFRLIISFFQIGRKFRDEMRPKNALLRCREFEMKGMALIISARITECKYLPISFLFQHILNLKIYFLFQHILNWIHFRFIHIWWRRRKWCGHLRKGLWSIRQDFRQVKFEVRERYVQGYMFAVVCSLLQTIKPISIQMQNRDSSSVLKGIGIYIWHCASNVPVFLSCTCS